MKSKILVIICVVFLWFWPSFVLGQEADFTNKEIEEILQPLLEEDVPGDLPCGTPYECRMKLCEPIWLVQPLLEKVLIPYIGYLFFKNGDLCGGLAFNVAIDSLFWIPLACYCNEGLYCGFWVYDILFNLASYVGYCT